MAKPVAARLLREWRTSEKKSQGEVAAALSIQQPTLSEYEKGIKVPRTVLALRIARLTQGTVPVQSWEDTEPDAAELASAALSAEPALDAKPDDASRFDTLNDFGKPFDDSDPSHPGGA